MFFGAFPDLSFSNLARMTLKKRSVAIELRLRAEAEARKVAAQKLKVVMLRFFTGTLTLTTLLILVSFDVLAIAEPVIEEIHGAMSCAFVLKNHIRFQRVHNSLCSIPFTAGKCGVLLECAFYSILWLKFFMFLYDINIILISLRMVFSSRPLHITSKINMCNPLTISRLYEN